MGFMLRKKSRGVITVMLTVILVPILACSSVLVELARYRSYKNLYDEIAELSALSALSDYDTELYSQYGLLGMSQNQSAKVASYVQANLNTDLGVFQRFASPASVGVSTDMLYSLANTQVLERQILEAEKIQGPLSLATGILSGGDLTLDSLLKKIQESIEKAIPGYKMIKSISKSASNLADVADAVTTIIEEREKWQTKADEYTDKYREFATAMNGYMEARNAQAAAESSFHEAENAYNASVDEEGNGDEGLKNNRDEAAEILEEAEAAVEEAAGKLALAKTAYMSSIDALRTQADSFFKAVEDLAKDAIKFRDSLVTKGIDATKAEAEEEIDSWLTAAKNAANGRTDITDEYRATLIQDYTDTAKALKDEAKAENSEMKSTENIVVGLANNLASFTYASQMSVLDSNIGALKSHVDGYMSALSEQNADAIVAGGGHFYYTQNQLAGAGVNLEDLLHTLDALNQVSAESAVAGIKEVLTQLYNLVRMFESTFEGYEVACNSVIADAASLPSHSGAGEGDTFIAGDDAQVEELLNSMASMADMLGYEIEELYPSTHLANAEFNSYIEELIHAVVTDIQVICHALKTVSNVLTGKFWEIIKAVKDVANAFEAVIDLAEKLPQIVSNFGEVVTCLISSLYEGALIQEYAFQRFTTRMDYKTSSGSFAGAASSTKFVTAEVEYLVNGSPSEKENQQNIFWFILIIRLLMNTVQIITDSNIAGVASGAGPFAPLVYIVWIVAETYIDTSLLTETTAKIPLVKSHIMLSLEGLANLVAATINASTGLTLGKNPAETVDTIKETMGDIINEVYEDDILKMNYEDFMWVRLSFVGNKTKLRRIADLIQMNMKQTDEGFKLAETYTYLRVELEGDYNTILPTFNLVDGGRIGSLKYVGY